LAKTTIFDRPVQSESRDARTEFLCRVVAPWKSELNLRSVLDLGCGVGHFSAALRDLGLQVTAVDAREENISEARSRIPGVDFRVADAEDPSITALGTFDLVACFGLLYHLENPLLAMRNIRALTGKLMLLESMFVEEEHPILFLQDEPPGDDQSLRSVSCYPSEGAIIKMAYRAGFPNVYRFRELPNHNDFRPLVGRSRMRTVVAASNPPMTSPLLEAAAEPKSSRDLWTTDPTGISKMLRKIRRNVKVLRSK